MLKQQLLMSDFLPGPTTVGGPGRQRINGAICQPWYDAKVGLDGRLDRGRSRKNVILSDT
jgi:hypothetical protein